MPLSRTQPLTVWYPMALFTRTRIKVPKDILLPTFQQIIFILLFTALPKDYDHHGEVLMPAPGRGMETPG